MKIEIDNCDNFCYNYRYDIFECNYTQEEYDYIYKYLDFNKLDKDCYIYFSKKETEECFFEAYLNSEYLDNIYRDHLKNIYFTSPLGYEWLKSNWGKGIFKITVWYLYKQELKTIVNRVINIKLIKSK